MKLPELIKILNKNKMSDELVEIINGVYSINCILSSLVKILKEIDVMIKEKDTELAIKTNGLIYKYNEILEEVYYQLFTYKIVYEMLKDEINKQIQELNVDTTFLYKTEEYELREKSYENMNISKKKITQIYELFRQLIMDLESEIKIIQNNHLACSEFPLFKIFDVWDIKRLRKEFVYNELSLIEKNLKQI